MKEFAHKLALLHKYFFRTAPHAGPVQETSLGINYLGVDIDELYAAIADVRFPLTVAELGDVEYHDRRYPIFKITKEVTDPNADHLMVWSAFHGNEDAATLALPFLLNDLQEDHPQYRGVKVTLLAPLNPVGVVHNSRYNGQGIDINRDFVHFRTKEAAIVRDVLAVERPDFVVTLHEGPQNGTFLCPNQFVRPRVYSAILRNLFEQGIELADKDFVGRKLRTRGLQKVDGVIVGFGEFAKHILGLQTSGHFVRERRIPLITVETPWRNPDPDQRIVPQVQVVRTVAERLRKR